MLLTRLFEESEPKFKCIRERLNVLRLERQNPKNKARKTSKSSITSQSKPVSNPCEESGKAGKTSHWVLVGEVCNLHKSSKKKPARRGSGLGGTALDLYGLTHAEALYELEKSLEGSVDNAMNGANLFVKPVCIVCGGGNQVLSEVVLEWVQSNTRVAKAPKSWRR